MGWNDDGNRITFGKVERMINRLQHNKVVEVEEIKLKLIEYGGMSSLKLLHRII